MTLTLDWYMHHGSLVQLWVGIATGLLAWAVLPKTKTYDDNYTDPYFS